MRCLQMLAASGKRLEATTCLQMLADKWMRQIIEQAMLFFCVSFLGGGNDVCGARLSRHAIAMTVLLYSRRYEFDGMSR